MNIIYPKYQWAFELSPRIQTTHLILHHSATSEASAESIHQYHKSIGWAGIAYHFLVRKNGSIYAGRPINMMGGHTRNYNHCSIGICFEGNFDKEFMPDKQISSGRELILDLISKYPSVLTAQHKEFANTNCAGANFPFIALVNPNDEGDDELPETNPSDWAKAACDWAVNKGLIKGDGNGNFRWREFTTREELSVVLMRYSNN